ncbi:MAG TPA: hypothetical protein VGF67_04835 [Ktedonobacteraceae bacterium]|jgi:hypothetical protein
MLEMLHVQQVTLSFLAIVDDNTQVIGRRAQEAVADACASARVLDGAYVLHAKSGIDVVWYKIKEPEHLFYRAQTSFEKAQWQVFGVPVILQFFPYAGNYLDTMHKSLLDRAGMRVFSM